MATEYPALNRIHVVGYSANDTDYPILGLVADPRVAGYKVPEDFSACPDKRYPNHIFTGAQPISGDQRVRHIWEILPSPWVPFTRYDDDLGPIQGRRRSVKNEGQVASLASDKRTTYEAREGSAVVYNETEESWSIKTDDGGNSLFPIKIRDFYDASRGAVEETRQLFVPTGEEVGSLENINGAITQTSYEPYNEFLSVKIVQTYKVDGPQLIGKATNNEGQLVTITTQRKGASGYISPSPTALKSVDVSREDAESVVERITDAPSVFEGKTLGLVKPDVTPEKWRASIPSTSVERTVAGAVEDPIVLSGNQISKSEQQVTEFVKRVRTEERDPASSGTLTGEAFTNELGGGTAVVTEKYGTNPTISPSYGTVSAEKQSLGDGKFVTREVVLPTPPELLGQDYDDQLDIIVPFTQKFVQPNEGVGDARTEIQPRDVHHSLKRKVDIDAFKQAALAEYWKTSEMVDVSLPDKLVSVSVLKYIAKSTGQSASHNMSTGWTLASEANGNITVTYTVRPEIVNGYSGKVPAIRLIFFLEKEVASIDNIIQKTKDISGLDVELWPSFLTKPITMTLTSGSISRTKRESKSWESASATDDFDNSLQCSVVNIPPTLHDDITVDLEEKLLSNLNNPLEWTPLPPRQWVVGPNDTPPPPPTPTLVPDLWKITCEPPDFSGDYDPKSISATNFKSFPSGNFIVNIDSQSYRFGLVRTSVTIAQITEEYL